MAFVPSSPITGSAQTGLTTPTYTIVADQAPDANGKQYYVSALGGTQTGVTAHSVAAPFTCSMFRPKVLKTLAPVNPVTGVLRNVPVNTYKCITRKGVLPLAGQAFRTGNMTSELNVPAGADLADPLSVRAMISAHIGLLTQLSNEFGNTAVTGTI
jgi:hypothetical protein